MNDALNLCIQYNNNYNLKVHLHYLTYRKAKKKCPQVLTQKSFIEENKEKFKDKLETTYDILFGSTKKKKKKEKK